MKVDPRAALLNRLALTGGRFTREELDDWHERQDEAQGIIAGEDPDDDIGAIDINPMNYLASAATGAFGGILSKADQDLEDVQKALRKKKKKKKRKAAEPEPEPEQMVPPPQPLARGIPKAINMLIPWHLRYRQMLWGAGGVAVGAIALKLLRR